MAQTHRNVPAIASHTTYLAAQSFMNHTAALLSRCFALPCKLVPAESLVVYLMFCPRGKATYWKMWQCFSPYQQLQPPHPRHFRDDGGLEAASSQLRFHVRFARVRLHAALLNHCHPPPPLSIAQCLFSLRGNNP